MTPERLVEIEALAVAAYAPGRITVSGKPPKPYGLITLHEQRAVPELCIALREAWAEVAALQVRCLTGTPMLEATR
jgi:hypothetical protein